MKITGKVFTGFLVGIFGMVHSATSTPNLGFATITGWDDSIVVSTVTGTHTNDLLTPTDTLYVDWSIWNNGSSATAVRFYSELYVDGELKQTWQADPPVDSGSVRGAVDYSIGTLATGIHTITVKVDTTDVIAEMFENDNEYTKTIAVGLADLRLYKPPAWSDKIVVSKVAGTNTDDGLLTQNDTLYIDWAVANKGAVATDMRFNTELYLDGVLKTEWGSNPPMDPENVRVVNDYSIGTLTPGVHTIKVIVDSTDVIVEMDEIENEYTKIVSIALPDDVAFFRIEGEAESVITDFDAGAGVLIWSNAVAGTTNMVQRIHALGGTSNWTDYVKVATNSLVYTAKIIDLAPPEGMVFIPAGMNTGTESFFMDRTEVTKTQWDEVYNWATNHNYTLGVGSGKAPNHPVHTVSWYDCVKWCNARSEMEGRTPCYTVSSNVYRTGSFASASEVVQCDFDANGYRLPTGEERYSAACGGLSGMRFPWGDTIQHTRANYESDSSYGYDTSSTRGYHPAYAYDDYPYTSPAGSFAANGYGLYDMCGNVAEWIWDLEEYGDRFFACGSYSSDAFWARISVSTINYPSNANNTLGFRTVSR